jgi:hypothetical protein
MGIEDDTKKLLYHYLEEAALGGYPSATQVQPCRHRIERAVRHLIIAANLGFDGAINDEVFHQVIYLNNKAVYDRHTRNSYFYSCVIFFSRSSTNNLCTLTTQSYP